MLIRTTASLVILAAAALLSGCKKAPTIVTFEVVDSAVYPSEELNALLGTQRYLQTRQVYTQLARASSDNGTSAEQLQSATLDGVELLLTSRSSAQNFDFLRAATIYLVSSQGTRSVLAQTTIIPVGATRLTFAHSGPAMTHELKAGSYYVAPMVELQPGSHVVADMQLQFRYQVEARKP